MLLKCGSREHSGYQKHNTKSNIEKGKKKERKMPIANFTVVNTTRSIDGSDDLYLVDATSGNITITLPDASSNDGLWVRLQRTDSSTNTVTVIGYSAQTINGNASFSMFRTNDVQIVTSSSAWIGQLPPVDTWTFASGTPVTIEADASNASTTGCVMGYDDNVSGVDVSGGSIDLTGSVAQKLNLSRLAGNSGTLTTLTIVYSNVTVINLASVTATVRNRVYTAAANSNTFSPTSAYVDLVLPSNLALGTISTTSTATLNLPITKGVRYILVGSLLTTGSAAPTSLSGYVSTTASTTTMSI